MSTSPNEKKQLPDAGNIDDGDVLDTDGGGYNSNSDDAITALIVEGQY